MLGNDPGTPSSRTTPPVQKIKVGNPDRIYVGGIFDNNGGQLIKDKVAVLGDNQAVKLMGPDGFPGYPSSTAAGGAGHVPVVPGSTNE